MHASANEAYGQYSPQELPSHTQTDTCRTHTQTNIAVPYRGKGWRAHQQVVSQDPDAPAVHLVGVADVGFILILLRVRLHRAAQHLWGEVVNRAQPVARGGEGETGQ